MVALVDELASPDRHVLVGGTIVCVKPFTRERFSLLESCAKTRTCRYYSTFRKF
jgi:hypothetical protein